MEMSSNHFPVEILYNILGRLPAKDIIRFRCVCKAWRDFVTDPNFVSTHLNFQTDSRRCLTAFQDATFAEHSNLEVPFTCEISYFHVVGCVNGLICLSPYSGMFGRTLYLWNPSIWKLKVLRHSCFHCLSGKNTKFFALGFGFHHRTNDYKIVRIVYSLKNYPFVEEKSQKVEVFSLARNSWRNVGTNDGCIIKDTRSAVVVNDCVHWMAFRAKNGYGLFVLTFDFDSEKFGAITLPKYLYDGNSQSAAFGPHVHVEVLRESLALIECVEKIPGVIECCNIWVMTEYGVAESWTKQYFFVPNKSCFWYLGNINNGDLIFDAREQEGLISYDLYKQEYKHLGFAENIDCLVTFRESLVLYKEGIRLTPRKNLLAEGGIHLGKRKWSVFMLLQKKWL